jgi:hypothetical protein
MVLMGKSWWEMEVHPGSLCLGSWTEDLWEFVRLWSCCPIWPMCSPSLKRTMPLMEISSPAMSMSTRLERSTWEGTVRLGGGVEHLKGVRMS